MNNLETIRAKLAAGLHPSLLDLRDESAAHQGHSGAPAGGNSHFRLKIVSDRFTGLPPVARHRLVYELLQEELATTLHALAITALTPDELAKKSQGAAD